MNTTETTQRAQEVATKAQDVAVQVKDQAKTLVDEARSSELASAAADVAQQAIEKARDLASGLATEVAERTGRSKPSRLRRIGGSIRNHPVRVALGAGAIAGIAYSVRNRRRLESVAATSGAPSYTNGVEGTPTYADQVAAVEDETVTPLNEPANR